MVTNIFGVQSKTCTNKEYKVLWRKQKRELKLNWKLKDVWFYHLYKVNISFENSWHIAMPPMVSLQKYDFWETN